MRDIDSFIFPEVYLRKALGFLGIPKQEVIKFFEKNGLEKLFILGCGIKDCQNLISTKNEICLMPIFKENSTYLSITSTIARKWCSNNQGFMLGDPVLVSYWLSWLCRNNYLALYSQPQTEVINEMKEEIGKSSGVVYGRQYDDQDILELAKLGKSFQLVDPLRPPFPATTSINYSLKSTDSIYNYEPSDKELLRHAKENKILSSLIFWSGQIREIENFKYILDLVVMSRIKIGLAISAEQLDYALPGLLELVNVSLEEGGVSPNVELIFSITSMEAYLDKDTLFKKTRTSADQMRRKLNDGMFPRGWYVTLDSVLVPGKKTGNNTDRPYADFRPARFNKNFAKIGSSANLEYLISKVDSGLPKILYLDDNFIALNYSAGKWSGWSPFVDINSVYDIKTAEKNIFNTNSPGWLIGNLDSCLWTFSKSQWERGHELLKITKYLTQNGISGKIVNTTPHVIARYARILADNGFMKKNKQDEYFLFKGRFLGNLKWLKQRIFKKVFNLIKK